MQTAPFLLLLIAAFTTLGQAQRIDVIQDVEDEADNYGYGDPGQSDPERSQDVRSPAVPESLRCQREASDGSIVCDCGSRQEPISLPAFRSFGEHYHIRNCRHLIIPAHTFAQAQALKSVHLTDIQQLDLEPYSLEFQPSRRSSGQRTYDSGQSPPLGIRVHLRRVRLPVLPSHTMRGNLELVAFDECRLEDVQPFAISTTQEMVALTLRGCWIVQMRRHALRKFAVGQLDVANCTFREAVPSAAVFAVTVREALRIVGSRFGDVMPNAFQFEAVQTFDLADNRFATLSGSSFHMEITDRCSVTGNNITELAGTTFLAIRSAHQSRPQATHHFKPPDFEFINNRLGNREPLALRLQFAPNAFQVRLQQLEMLEAFTCHALRTHQTTDFQRSHETVIRMRTCPDCEASSLQHLREQRCHEDRTLAWVAGGVSLMVLLLLATLVTVWWLYRRRKAALARMQVVQPEARTYRETQIVIQIENAGLLKTDL